MDRQEGGKEDDRGARRDFRQAGQGRPLQGADLRCDTRIQESEEESHATGKGTGSAKALSPSTTVPGSCTLTSAAVCLHWTHGELF